MMDWASNPEIWVALVTLTVLELVLGIDNIIFISILAGKLPEEQRGRARVVGLGLAMFTRILLLVSLTWLAHLSEPLVTVGERGVSARDVILFVGGLFLLAKSTREIHEKLEGHEAEAAARVRPTFRAVIVQIILLDIVFSIDSVITAVGMVEQVGVMVAAVVLAVIMMMFFSGPISAFVEHHPTVKMLALAFLLLIGVALIADGLHFHIPRGYVYFAMGFSVMVEMLNLRLRRKPDPPVQLRSNRTSSHGSDADPWLLRTDELLQELVDVRRLQVDAAAGEGQEQDALAGEGLGDLELHHHLAAAAGEGLVQLADALRVGAALGLDGGGDLALLPVVGVGLDLRLAELAVGGRDHLVDLALRLLELAQPFLLGGACVAERFCSATCSAIFLSSIACW